MTQAEKEEYKLELLLLLGKLVKEVMPKTTYDYTRLSYLLSILE